MRGRELAFVRAATAVQLTKDLTYRGFVARLRRIERHHVEQNRRQPRRLAREIRRRIAELLLKDATQRAARSESAGVGCGKLEMLGFTDIETKAFHTLIYARAARATGHLRLARQLANNMVEELKRALQRRNNHRRDRT